MKDDITLGLHLDDSKARAKGQKFAKDMSGLKIEPSLSLGKITTDFTKFEQSLDAATARVVAFTATTSLLYGVGSAFKRLTQDAIQIESVMARIQSIFGSTASETKQFQSAIFGLANDVGLSFFQVAEAAEEFSRQGLSLNKTLEATRAAAVVAKLSGAELKGVIEGLTATLSTFNDGTLDYIQVANKLVALDSAFATSAAGITEGLKRVSGVAVQAGLSFDETAAAITSLKQVTGRSEAVIGNSLKSIFTSLQTEKVQKDLATLGVETKDANGEFRNLVEVLSDLSKVYGTLGDAQKTVIAQRIGKTYQANAFQGILRTFETGDYEKALTTSKNAGSSAEDRLEKLNQTTQSALQRFSNNITQLGGNLGDKLGKPLLDTVVGYMNSAIEAGNKIFGGSGLGDALIGGLKNVLEGPGIVILTFSVAKLLTRIIKESGQAIKSITGLSGAKENILRIDQFITSNLSEQNKVELERIKTLTSVAAQQKAILDLMNRQLVTQEKMRSQGTLVKDYGITSLQSLGPAAASKAARKIPNRGKGELPEVNRAILREAVDIRNGVGGARATATPLVKTLNLGKGPEKVVVNSDEKIVPNFAGSGQHAVLNREMMGYAGGSIPKRYFPKDEYGYSKINRGVHDESFLEFKLDKKNKVIEVGKVFSRQKGDAFKNFQALAGFAGRSGFTIKSGDFTNQYISMVGDGGEKGFFKAFPQIRYREGLSSSTYGSYQFRHPYEAEKGERYFSSVYELKDQVKNLSQDQIRRIQFNDVFDDVLDLKYKTGKRNIGLGFSSGYIPSLASGSDPDKISKNILRQNKRKNKKIRDGVYGARATATPLVKTLNLGKGPEKVVVNSDEKIVKNFAGSGQDAILNREMMGYAVGKVPFSSKLGTGAFGSFYKYKKGNLGYKTVDPMYLKDPEGGLAADFHSLKKINALKDSGELPSYFDSVKTVGTLDRALKRNRLGKTVAGGKVVSGLDLPGTNDFFIGLQKYIATKTGVNFGDFHSGNFAANPAAEKAIKSAVKSLGGKAYSSENRDVIFDRIHKSLLSNRKAKLTVFDPGDYYSSGHIPSLANGRLPRNMQEALKARIRERLYNKQRYKDYVLPPLSSSPPFVPLSSTVLPPLSLPPPIPLLPASVTLPPLSPLPIGPPPIPPLPSSSTVLPPIATFSRVNPTRRSPSPNYTPISPIRGIKAPVQPLEKIGTRPSIDVRGNSLFGDAAKRASAEAQLNKNRERADRISSLIDSKKGLTQNAKQFVSANRGLFGESSLSSFDKRNRSFSQKIGGIGSKISNGVKNFNPGTAAGAGFAISFLGGSIAEGFKTKQGEDTQSSRGVGGLAQGVGIGAQLALFGKTAGIVGLVAGAAVGLNTAFGENLDRLNGLKEKHDALIKTYREEGESISLFSSNFQDLNDALDSGSEKAAKFAKEGIKKALEGISDEGLKNALVSAKTQEDVSRVVSENQNRRIESLSLSEAKVNIGDLLQSNRQGFFGGLVRKNTDSFGSFLGLNEGLDVGQIEKIASSLAGSIDVSKFNEKQRKVYSEKGVSTSALPPEVQAALREVESRFSGGSAKILSEISKKLIPKLTDNTSIIGDLEKKARKEHDFTNLISGSAQKANFSSFEKLIKSSLASSLSEISLQGAKPFTSEIAFAESQFAIDKSRRSQDLASKSAGLNASLIEKAQELTKGRNLDFAQLGKIQDAFSKFGKTQDVGTFLKDFEGIIGTDSKEFVKFAQGQFLERKKLSAEAAAGNQEADARQRTLIEELKRGQRATLFGGGLNKFDRGQANPGLVEILRGPKYNKFNDPTRPGFGLDEKTGRKTFSLGEYAQEESKILDANENRYDKIIQRAQYLKESGYFGVEPTADTPENLKDQRQKLLEQERKPLVEALIGKRQKFAKDLALSESGSYVSAINADSKRITGGIAITTEQKKVIADAIKSGSYDTAIGALDESTKNLTKDYGFSGKSDELGKIDAFRTFLQQQKENSSNISLAAEEQAKNILPDQTLEGQNIQLLTEIKDEGVKTNENLSKLAELMSQIQTKDLNLSKTTAVGEGISELSSLEMKLAEKNSPLEFDKLKKDLEFDIKRGAIEGNPLDPSVLSNFGGDGSSVSPESLGNYFKYKNKYENPSALEKIYSNRIGRFSDQKSIDRDLESIKSKASGTSKIKDELEKSNVLDSLIESIKGLKDELGKRLDSGKTSKIDQNINLDINATVAGTNVLASEDFKNSLTAFVGSYVKNVWKENTGNIMIEPPSNGFATA